MPVNDAPIPTRSCLADSDRGDGKLVFIVVSKPGEIKASAWSGRPLVMRTVGGIAVAGCVDKTKRKEGNSL
jgi:hypothetical protein